MARKSRYTGYVQEIPEIRPHCIAAIYLRLSVEDGDSLESNSIGNQRKICLAFLEKHSDFEIGAFYVDDGCTGMNYKRPGFQAMFADLRAKKVNCIIVKDISRLGRHYIMTSEYVEKVFPEMGVRLICINDDYDSEDTHSDRDGLLMPFKLVMNDTYVKDTARRIQSSIHAKMDSGEYLPSSGSVPYGYRRAPEKGTFEIDRETAPVVRRIFEMRAEGMMFNTIAKVLNQEGIPSPGKIRYDRGLTKAEKFKNALWLRGTIRKLTGDAVYIGSRIHGKVARERLGGDKKARPKELWQIIPNAHPPIVMQALFDQVQEINQAELERRAAYDTLDNPDPDYRDIFRGKVFCGECGARMTAGILAGRKTTPVSVYFNCNQYRYSNHSRCSYYGQQQSAAAVEDSGKELAERIRQIVEETGCEKVNIIAHSKGGLDSRAAIAHCGMAPYVATLTTINTPHRGCIFAEYLLGKVPQAARLKIAAAYNAAMKQVGDPNLDFLAAVTDLTESACLARNEAMPDVLGVVYESVMSYCKKAQHGKFPLNMTYPIVKHFDGLNDGLVSVESAKWGERFTLLEPQGKRGISHGDVVDLNRENIRGFDVREFYVKLAADLKRRGY